MLENRAAVITIKDDPYQQYFWPAICLQWNGGLDSVGPVLAVCKELVNIYGDSPRDAILVLENVLYKWRAIGGRSIYGSFNAGDYHNGVYIIDKGFNIIGREFMYRAEEDLYDFNELKAEIMSKL